MRILAIETVDVTGSVAAFEDERALVGRRLDASMRSARSLAPAIKAILSECGWRQRDIQLVAVASGPGSFTGLRIGVTTAKVLAYAIGCEVLGVNTMSAIAARVPPAISQFSVAVDAQRGELFVADFLRGSDGALSGADTTRIVAAEPWLAELPSGTVLTGPGLVKWAAALRADLSVVEQELWPPTALAVGQVGRQMFAAGQRDDVMQLAPRYFRRTAAEEQWDRRQVPDDKNPANPPSA